MSTDTKAAPKPNAKQQDVLAALTGTRQIRVSKSAKGRSTAAVVSSAGKSIPNTKIEKPAVDSAISKGWLKELGASGDGNGGTTTDYGITDEGKVARRAGAKAAK